MPKGVRIRKIREKDAKEVSALIIKNLKEVNSRDYPKKIIDMLIKIYSPSKIKQRMKNGYMIVAEKDGKIIGTGRFYNGEIFDVFVLPALHGKGIGSKIMQTLEKIAIRQGYKRVFLPASKTAIGFYKKRGYKPVKNYKQSKTSFWMVKSL
jgi:N-acetylglutamate synthase-like GNAT family acetyltransferase